MKKQNLKKGAVIIGPPHELGGVKTITPAGPLEVEGNEIIINKIASEKNCELLSEINQSAGGGVAFNCDDTCEHTEEGGTAAKGRHITPDEYVYLGSFNKDGYLQTTHRFKATDIEEIKKFIDSATDKGLSVHNIYKDLYHNHSIFDKYTLEDLAEHNNQNKKQMETIRIHKNMPYMASLANLTGKDLKVKDIKVVDFASGKQNYYIVEVDGQEYEVPERFTEHGYIDIAAHGKKVDDEYSDRGFQKVINLIEEQASGSKSAEYDFAKEWAENKKDDAYIKDLANYARGANYHYIADAFFDVIKNQKYNKAAHGKKVDGIGFIPMDVEEDAAIVARWNNITVGDVLPFYDALIDAGITDDDLRAVSQKKRDKEITEIWTRVEKYYNGERTGNFYFSVIGKIIHLDNMGYNILAEYKPFKNNQIAAKGIKLNEMKNNYYYLKIGNKIIEKFGSFPMTGEVNSGGQYLYEIIGYTKNGITVKEHTITKSKAVPPFEINFYDLTKYMNPSAKGYQIDGKPLENERDEALLNLEIENIKSSFEKDEIKDSVKKAIEEVTIKKIATTGKASKAKKDLLEKTKGFEDTMAGVEAVTSKPVNINPDDYFDTEVFEHGYSYEKYDGGQWRAIFKFLLSEGYSLTEAKDVLLSKITRWTLDSANKSDGGNLKDFKKYYRKNKYIIEKEFKGDEAAKGKMVGGGLLDSREEHHGIKYQIWYLAPKGYHIVGSDIESKQIFKGDYNYFDKSEQAKEHAEISIESYLTDMELKVHENKKASKGTKVKGKYDIIDTPYGKIQIGSSGDAPDVDEMFDDAYAVVLPSLKKKLERTPTAVEVGEAMADNIGLEEEDSIKECIEYAAYKLKKHKKASKGTKVKALKEWGFKVGDKAYVPDVVSKNKTGTITSINGTTYQIDFGNGDKYGIEEYRLKYPEGRKLPKTSNKYKKLIGKSIWKSPPYSGHVSVGEITDAFQQEDTVRIVSKISDGLTITENLDKKDVDKVISGKKVSGLKFVTNKASKGTKVKGNFEDRNPAEEGFSAAKEDNRKARNKKKAKSSGPKRGKTTLSERNYMKKHKSEFNSLKDAYPDSTYKELIAKHKKTTK